MKKAITEVWPKSLILLLVPGAGLEPARLSAVDFESTTSTDFVTRAVAGVELYQLAHVCSKDLPANRYIHQTRNRQSKASTNQHSPRDLRIAIAKHQDTLHPDPAAHASLIFSGQEPGRQSK